MAVGLKETGTGMGIGELSTLLNRQDLPESIQDQSDKMKNAAYYSETFGQDIRQAFDIEPELNERIYGKGTSSAGAWNQTKQNNEKANLWFSTMKSWRRGAESLSIDFIWHEVGMGRMSEAEATKITKEFEERVKADPIKARNWLENVYLKTVGVLPGIVGGLAEGAKYGLVGAGVGAGSAAAIGQVPPLTVVPEELGTIPAGAAAGLGLGQIVGQMKFWSEQGYGAIYRQARGQGVSKKTSRIVAAIGGPVYGAIEHSQVDKIVPGLARVKKGLLNLALKLATNIATEVGEEGAQRAVSDSAVLIGKVVENKIKLSEIPAETKTILLNSWSEMRESLGPMTILQGPGAAAATLNILMDSSSKKTPEIPMGGIEQSLQEELEKIVPTETFSQEIKEVPEVPVKAAPAAVEPSEAKDPTVKEIEELETPEEAKEAERTLDVEATEEIEAELYIGSITPGMKKRIEEGGQFKAEDIKGFHKPTGGPFSTIRKPFKLTRGEAEKYLEFLQNDLTRRLDDNLINTENDLAKANADWGDIRNIREALGLEKITRPFTVERAEGHKVKVIPNVKERIREAIRPTEESKMTVGELLRTTLKRSARFAKMGFVKGRQELRAELRAKARAKKRLNKALKVINQKVPSTVDFFFRETIEALRADLDLKSRGKRTEATIKSRKEFFERATEEQKKLIPTKQIKQLGQKSLNELTIEQLEEIAESVKELVKQGKLKRKLLVKPELKQRQKDIQELTENTEKVKPSRKKPGPQAKSVTEKNLKDKIFDIVKPLTWRPSRLFDWLDGRKNFKGAWHRIFFDNVKGARANQIRTANTRKESLTKEMKKIGITLWQLSGIKEVDGVRWGIQEMIGVYMASKNELSKLALNFGHDMTNENIEHVIAAMSDQEKALGDFLLADYKANYSKLRRSVIEQENRDSGIQENYSPIRRKGVNYTTLSAEFVDDILDRNTIRKHVPAKGMTIQRQNVPPSLQTEIRLDAVNVWNDQVEKEARYIFMGPVVRNMNKIMANRNLRKVVSERFGNEVVESIAGQQGYISRVANPYIYRQFGDIERISGKLRRNTATAYLAYNLVTMGKQLPSALLYLSDAGPSHLLASAIEFATNPRVMIDRTRSLDPELKNRSIERELEEIKNTHNGNLIKQKITNTGMEGIFLFDTIARTIGWNAVYQRAKNANESEGEAIRLARNATLRTQPAAAAEDLPALYTTSEFLNWFTMFTNQLNQIFNIATYDIPSYLKNEQYGDAALQAFGMGVVAVTIWMITNRKFPEEPEEFAEAISEQAINMIPLFGKPIMAARNGWDSEIPVFDAVKGLYGSIDDLDFTRQDSRELAEGIAVVTGIPYTAIRRGVQAIEEEQPTALLGERRPKKGKRSGRRGRRR